MIQHCREPALNHPLSETDVLSIMLDNNFCCSQSKGCRLRAPALCLWGTVINEIDVPVVLYTGCKTIVLLLQTYPSWLEISNNSLEQTLLPFCDPDQIDGPLFLSL
ncbi:hypothetical protein TNCV_2481481 [Trichonephila clavipes]|nr:hypothetical protein TNCV_2481481 [Trichonephila clavipes]